MTDIPMVFGLPPIWFLLIISLILSIGITLAYKYLTDQVLMRELKDEIKKMQAQIRKARDNPEKMMALQKKAMHANMRYMKQSLKPMIITMIPFLAIFAWLKSLYSDIVIIPLSFWPGHLGWIGVYIIFSMIFTTLFRKVMKVV